MSDGQQRDWFKTWVHFFCGLVAGGLVGLYTFQDSWIYVLVTALAVAILAAIYLDDFWDDFLRWR
jgi:hypothetical protein